MADAEVDEFFGQSCVSPSRHEQLEWMLFDQKWDAIRAVARAEDAAFAQAKAEANAASATNARGRQGALRQPAASARGGAAAAATSQASARGGAAAAATSQASARGGAAAASTSQASARGGAAATVSSSSGRLAPPHGDFFGKAANKFRKLNKDTTICLDCSEGPDTDDIE